MRTDLGYSLLELLIALAIGSVLSIALYQLYFHYQQQSLHQQAILSTQENTRLALHFLHDHLQNAGEVGCNTSKQLIIANQAADLPIAINLLKAHAIQGYEGHEAGWSPPLPEALLDKVAAHTDVVLSWGGSHQRSHLSVAMNDPLDPIYINQTALFAAGDIVLIADCTHADIFQISAAHNTPSGQILSHSTPQNAAAHLSRVYGQDAQVIGLQVDAYYLAHMQRNKAALALYRHTLLPETYPVEWVAGIEKFTVEYALLQHGMPRFVQAAQVDNYAQVRGLRLHILGVTPSNAAASHPYFWLNTWEMPQTKGFYWPAQMSVILYNQGI